MTQRCALYARHSSDQQRAASIEDQFCICREHAEREDWRVKDRYRDAAISGASVILRPGVQALPKGARRGCSGSSSPRLLGDNQDESPATIRMRRRPGAAGGNGGRA